MSDNALWSHIYRRVLGWRAPGWLHASATQPAGLMLDLAAHDVEDQSVTGDLLVGLDLDDVTGLDAAPVRDLEALVPL